MASFQLLLDDLDEDVERLGAVEHAPIDKKAGRAFDRERLGVRQVAVDERGSGRGIETGTEAPRVEAERARVIDQSLPAEIILLGEQDVVILPELPSLRGALRRDRGQPGLRVKGERQVLEDVSELGGIACQKLSNRWLT